MGGIDWRRWAATRHGPAEMIAASFAFFGGLWLASPGWTSFGTSPSYRVMSLIADEWLWGGLPMLAGVVLAWASLHGWSLGKHVALLFLLGYFVFVTVVFGVANIGSTAPITYFHVAVMFGWLWWSERRRDG